MATYFPSPDNQRESLPSSYSEGPVHPGNMMMYMNYVTSALPGASDSNPSQQEILSHLGGPRVGEQDLNEWKDDRSSSMLLMHHHHPQHQQQHHHPMGSGAAPGGVFQGQGLLSLTLSTHVPSGFQMPSFQCRTPDQGFSSFLSSSQEDTGRNGSLGNNNSNIDIGSPNKQSRIHEYVPTGWNPGANADQMTTDASQYGISGGSIARAIPNSKYLKAAQQLLDEVVNVKKALKEQQCKNRSVKDSSKSVEGGARSGASEPPGTGSSSNLEESSTNSPVELSAAEKQDLQNKMTKLLAMLDEVDRRYKQYHHQMQIVVSSFDVVAGCGAAKPYTALALQTISRHFRCLRDAISEQLQITRKNLGEQHDGGPDNCKGIGISRLRYVDQQIRQQRALQQIGMMQQHAWRPQRGLPESSVSVLRAWLFEHFLHPYPKDSDKIMLARQTGLTRSQVSNWFINARVRLWKPMVEEMYKEEIGDGEMDINSPSDLATKGTNSEAKASEEDLQQSTTSTPTQRCSTGQLYESRSDDHFTDVELMEPNNHNNTNNVDLAYTTAMGHTETENDEYAVGLGKSRGRNRRLESNGNDDCTMMIPSSEGSNRLMAAAAAAAAAYHMSELERFENNGSGVSLTLGLQQCEGSNIPMSIETHQGYVPTAAIRGDGIYAAAAASSMGPDATEFDCMDGANRVTTTHHRFSSSHLLHDFVA